MLVMLFKMESSLSVCVSVYPLHPDCSLSLEHLLPSSSRNPSYLSRLDQRWTFYRCMCT